MIEVNEDLTRKVAHLARLEISSEEATTFTSQLREILGYVGQLQQVDVTGVEPLLSPLELATPFREDEVRPSPVDSDGRSKMLGAAPDIVADGFKVPPIL